MKVNAYKITLLVLDFDGLGEKGLIDAIENVTYPNRCLSPSVHGVESRTVEWSDDHPLNKLSTAKAEFDRLFDEDNNEQ